MPSLTPDDDWRPAAGRTVPTISRQIKEILTGTTPGYIDLPEDVKTCLIKAKGADVLIWPSYFNPQTETDTLSADDSTTATQAHAEADDRVKEVDDGEIFSEAQEKEFNRIHIVPTGDCRVLAYPGKGQAPA